jgi:hypothetical protein
VPRHGSVLATLTRVLQFRASRPKASRDSGAMLKVRGATSLPHHPCAFPSGPLACLCTPALRQVFILGKRIIALHNNTAPGGFVLDCRVHYEVCVPRSGSGGARCVRPWWGKSPPTLE